MAKSSRTRAPRAQSSAANAFTSAALRAEMASVGREARDERGGEDRYDSSMGGRSTDRRAYPFTDDMGDDDDVILDTCAMPGTLRCEVPSCMWVMALTPDPECTNPVNECRTCALTQWHKYSGEAMTNEKDAVRFAKEVRENIHLSDAKGFVEMFDARYYRRYMADKVASGGEFSERYGPYGEKFFNRIVDEMNVPDQDVPLVVMAQRWILHCGDLFMNSERICKHYLYKADEKIHGYGGVGTLLDQVQQYYNGFGRRLVLRIAREAIECSSWNITTLAVEFGSVGMTVLMPILRVLHSLAHARMPYSEATVERLDEQGYHHLARRMRSVPTRHDATAYEFTHAILMQYDEWPSCRRSFYKHTKDKNEDEDEDSSHLQTDKCVAATVLRLYNDLHELNPVDQEPHEPESNLRRCTYMRAYTTDMFRQIIRSDAGLFAVQQNIMRSASGLNLMRTACSNLVSTISTLRRDVEPREVYNAVFVLRRLLTGTAYGDQETVQQAVQQAIKATRSGRISSPNCPCCVRVLDARQFNEIFANHLMVMDDEKRELFIKSLFDLLDHSCVNIGDSKDVTGAVCEISNIMFDDAKLCHSLSDVAVAHICKHIGVLLMHGGFGGKFSEPWPFDDRYGAHAPHWPDYVQDMELFHDDAVLPRGVVVHLGVEIVLNVLRDRCLWAKSKFVLGMPASLNVRAAIRVLFDGILSCMYQADFVSYYPVLRLVPVLLDVIENDAEFIFCVDTESGELLTENSGEDGGYTFFLGQGKFQLLLFILQLAIATKPISSNLLKATSEGYTRAKYEELHRSKGKNTQYETEYFIGPDTPFEFAKTAFKKEQQTVMRRVKKCLNRQHTNGFAYERTLDCASFAKFINGEDAMSNYQLDAALALYAMHLRTKRVRTLFTRFNDKDWKNGEVSYPFTHFGNEDFMRQWGIGPRNGASSGCALNVAPGADYFAPIMRNEDLKLSLPLVDPQWIVCISENPRSLDRFRQDIVDGLLDFYNQFSVLIGGANESFKPKYEIVRINKFTWSELELLLPTFEDSSLKLLRAIKTLRRVWYDKVSFVTMLLLASFTCNNLTDMPADAIRVEDIITWLARNLVLLNHISQLLAERPHRPRYERKRLRVLEVMYELTEALNEFVEPQGVWERLFAMDQRMAFEVVNTLMHILNHDFYLAPESKGCRQCMRSSEVVDLMSVLLINAASPFARHDRLLGSKVEDSDTSHQVWRKIKAALLRNRNVQDAVDPAAEEYVGDPAVLGAQLKLSVSCLKVFSHVLMFDCELRGGMNTAYAGGVQVRYALKLGVNTCSQSSVFDAAAFKIITNAPGVLDILSACVSAPLHMTEQLDDVYREYSNYELMLKPLANHARLLLEVSSQAACTFSSLFAWVDFDEEHRGKYSIMRRHKTYSVNFINRLSAVVLVLSKMKLKPVTARAQMMKTGDGPWKLWGLQLCDDHYLQYQVFIRCVVDDVKLFLEHVPSAMSYFIDALDWCDNTGAPLSSALHMTHGLVELLCNPENGLPTIDIRTQQCFTKYAARLIFHPRVKLFKRHLLQMVYALAPTRDHIWLLTGEQAIMGNVCELNEELRKSLEVASRVHIRRCGCEHVPSDWGVGMTLTSLLGLIERLCSSRPWRHFLLSIDEKGPISIEDKLLTENAIASLAHLSESESMWTLCSRGLRTLQCLAGFPHNAYEAQLTHKIFDLGSDPSSLSAVLRSLRSRVDIFCPIFGIFSGPRRSIHIIKAESAPSNTETYTLVSAKAASELTAMIFSRLTIIGEEIVEYLYTNKRDRILAIEEFARDMLRGVEMSGNNYASAGAHILFLLEKRKNPYTNHLPRQITQGGCVERAMMARSLIRGSLGPAANPPNDPTMRFQTDLIVTTPRKDPLDHVCSLCLNEDEGLNLPPFHGVIVKFRNELGEGAGVRREWFTIIGEQATNLDWPLFISYDGATVHPHPNIMQLSEKPSASREYFYALGKIAGLALYHGEILPIRFSEAFMFAVMRIDKVRFVAELGCFESSDRTTLNLQANIETMWSSPDFALRDLFWKLDPEFCEQVEESVLGATAEELEALDLTFTDTFDFTAGKGGIGHVMKHYDLLSNLIKYRAQAPSTKTYPPGYSTDMEGGADVKVTIENRFHYVRWLAYNRCFGRCLAEISEFVSGMISIIGSDTLHAISKLFTPKEFTELLAGKENISIQEWRQFTQYDKLDDWHNFSESYTVQVFWKSLEISSQKELMQVLEFTTGLKRPPVAGFRNLSGLLGNTQQFTIGALPAPSRYDKRALPIAHTCFNTLRLPFFQVPPTDATPEEKEKILLDDAFVMLEKLRIVCDSARRGFDSF